MGDSELPAFKPTPDAANKRLESWKEIAAYLRRDARTVQRWERLEGLPVHRHFHGRQGTVYAFEAELHGWWESRRARLDAPAGEAQASGSGPQPVEEPAVRAVPESTSVALPPQRAAAAPNSPATDSGQPRPEQRPRSRLAVAVLAIAAGVVLVLLVRASSGSVAGWLRLGRAHASRAAGNPEAQALYLQGRYYWDKRSAPDLTRAVDYFTQAIVHDPNYAPAYVGLADCYDLLREYGTMPDREAFPRAYAAAKKAVELDDSSSDAHTSLGFVSFYGNWDPVSAEREFNRAIQLDPSNVRAHHWHATFLMTVGREQEAVAEINRAQELDPRSDPILADKGLILFNVGHTDEALALLHRLEQDEPNFVSAHRYLASIALNSGDYRTWLAESRQAARLARDDQQLALIDAQRAGFEHGGIAGLLEVVHKQQEEQFRKRSLQAYAFATVCAKLGDKQKALEYLQLAYDQHEANVLFLRTDRNLASLRAEPAYRDLVKRVYPNQ